MKSTFHLGLSSLSALADTLVDDVVGIIRYVRELPREPGAPDFFHYYAEACNTAAFASQGNFRSAGGASTDREGAISKALGEAVERYCSAVYDRNDLPLTSLDHAPFACVTPDEFALYSPEQLATPNFPFVPFQNSTLLHWAPMTEPDTGQTWHVPASMVFMPYAFDRENGEVPIGQRISTGLACHGSYEAAAVSAICEVIERDAFTITWQAQLSMPHIRLESLTDRNRNLVQAFQQNGDVVTLLNLTLDHGVPTVAAALHSLIREAPAFVIATSTALDPEIAIRKSLEELAHTRRLADQLHRSQPTFLPSPHYANVVTQDDHVHMYTDHTNAPLADFLRQSAVMLDFHEMPCLTTHDWRQDLTVLIDRVKSVRHRILLADVTSDDISGLGLRVVRASIPGFHPLVMGHRLRVLGGTRLWTVPQRLGYGGISPSTGDNPAPHPFP